MRWQWLYRDFVTAFDAAQGEDDWIETYTRLYLDPHLDLLTRLHFAPKGYPTTEAALARVRYLGRHRYRSTVEGVRRLPDIEDVLPSTAAQLLAVLGAPEPDISLHVIVGLDCTNIYSVAGNGEPATVLCLEAVDADPVRLRLLLAHEAHHWARQASRGPDILTASVGERLAAEGLAIAFSRHSYPGLAPWEYCFVPETTYRWVAAHRAQLGTLVETGLDDGTLMDALFARTPRATPLPGTPPRTGYVYGYLVVTAADRGLVDFGVGTPWRLVVGKPWRYSP